MLPHAAERNRKRVNNWSALSAQHVAQAREQIRTFEGQIWLVPTAGDYLEAVLAGGSEGLLKLVLWGKLSNVVAERRFGHDVTPRSPAH